MIVRYFASEWCMTSLFQKGKIYGMWRFSLSFIVSSCTTKPLSSQFCLDNAEENVAYLVLVQWWGDDRQVSQSGKPLCTGASLWAVPKLARGLCLTVVYDLLFFYLGMSHIIYQCPADASTTSGINKPILRTGIELSLIHIYSPRNRDDGQTDT